MNNWKIENLHNKITIKHGFPFKSEFFSELQTDYIVLTPGNFHEEGGFKRQAGKEKFFTGEIPDEYLHSEGDLIVAMTEQAQGLLGSCARIPITGVYLHNQRLGLINAKSSEISLKYVYHLFKTKTVREQIRASSSGSKVKHTSPERIYDVKVLMPSLIEQRKIATVLDVIEDKIELNNKINTELEAMAKLIYDYWFVQFDFPDENGKPYKSSGGKMVYNEELKREIPEGWEVFQLSKILKSNYSSIGKDDYLDSIEYLDTGSLTKNIIESTEKILPERDKVPSRAKRIINKNDILYSTVRPNLCHYGIIKDPLKNMIGSTGFVQLSSKIDWVSNDFIYSFLTSSWVTERLHQIAALAVSAYPSISPTDISNLIIPLPKKGLLMENVNKQFDQINSRISLNQKENKQLSNLRDWLLPMLMNGQVSINNNESACK